MKKFNGKAKVIEMPTGSNSGKEFENRREKYYGGSDAAALCGYSNYKSELLACAQKSGKAPKDSYSEETLKRFAIGHQREKDVAETNARFMAIESGFEIIAHPCDTLEWSNEEWPHARAHIDYIIEVVKGKIIENPDFTVEGSVKNWLILPDNENHLYVADSKTVQTQFGRVWNKKDSFGLPVGGLLNGVCPTSHWFQLQFYMAVTNIDGGLILGSTGSNDIKDYTQVFVPYDMDKAQLIMDTCESCFVDAVEKGILPKVLNCEDSLLAASELPKIYPDINRYKRCPILKPDKWKPVMDRVSEIDIEIQRIQKEDLDPIEAERKEAKNKIDTLREERLLLLLSPLEDAKDAPGCVFIDPETTDAYLIEYESEPRMTKDNIKWLKKEYPEVYCEALERDPRKTVKLTRTSATKAKVISRKRTRRY